MNAIWFKSSRFQTIILHLSYLAYFSKLMSKHDSSLSKDQFNLLKAFKKQISNPQASAIAKQAESQKAPAIAEELEDTELFKKALLGVKPIDNQNIADTKVTRR